MSAFQVGDDVESLMYAIGAKVWKGGAHYSGPGQVVSFFFGLDPQNTVHYIVAHNIDGGTGYFYHVYTSAQLTVVAQPDEPLVPTTVQELRDLAKTIEQACAASRSMSIALPVVQNCTDHLLAIARVHELNQETNHQ